MFSGIAAPDVQGHDRHGWMRPCWPILSAVAGRIPGPAEVAIRNHRTGRYEL